MNATTIESTQQAGTKKRSTSRRGNGEGSILLRSDGRWQARVSFGYGGDGKRKRFSIYGRTKKDVHEKLLKLRSQRNDNTLTQQGKQTVSQFLNHWLQNRAEISDRTRDNYQRSIDQQIGRRIGAIQLSKLTPMDVQSLYSQMRTSKVGKDTIKLAHNVLHAALEQAVKWNLVAINVADRVEKPQIERQEVVPATLDQIKAFLAAAQGDRLEALYVLAIGSGMRLGELFGLQWADVDLDKGVIAVRHSLSELNGILKLKEPKTKAGRRRIELSDAIVVALVKHRRESLREGNAGAQYVFCNLHGGPLRRSHFHRQDFKPLLIRAGLPEDMHFHHLRHAHASLLIQQGENPKLVSTRLGHSKIGITMDLYSHLMPGADRDAANKLNALLAVKPAIGVANA
jgi:integrase